MAAVCFYGGAFGSFIQRLAGTSPRHEHPTARGGRRRKVRVRVPPEYPELARRLRIVGAVKIQVVVSPAGKVRSTKVVGGHPLLIQAALDAVRRWKFEPANEESSLVVEVRFKPVATVGS